MATRKARRGSRAATRRPAVVGYDPTITTPFGYGATGATNTTVRATVNPSGGTASNTTDVTNIQNAINTAYAAGGGIVNLTAGTYRINGSRVQMRSGVKLQGLRTPGSDPTVILKAGTNFFTGPEWGGCSVITTYDYGESNMTIKDILCDQSGNTLNGNSLSGRLSAYLCEFRGATNVVMDGVYTRNPFTYSIVMADCTTFGIRNCNVKVESVGVYDQLDGIHILQGSNGDVVDNYVDNGFSGTSGDGDDGLVAHTIDDVCHHVNYINNYVRGGRHGSGIQLAGGSTDIYNIVIKKNTFVGTSTPEGVYFGYYGSATSSVYNITVGGAPGDGNLFDQCTEFSVDLTAGPCTATTVSYNARTGGSGPYNVPAGGGNVVANNT